MKYSIKDLRDPKVRKIVFQDLQDDWDCYLCFGMSKKELYTSFVTRGSLVRYNNFNQKSIGKGK